MEIRTDRLHLREIENKDADKIAALLNNIEISKYLANVPYPYTMDHAEEFVKRCQHNATQKPRKFYEFVITLQSNGNVLGVISLKELDEEERRCEIVYWLDKKHWREGYITEAFQKLMQVAFDEIGMKRIDLTITSSNIPARHIATKMGFHFEGISKSSLKTKSTGEIHDVHRFAKAYDDDEEEYLEEESSDD